MAWLETLLIRRQLARLFLLFGEQPRVFDRDARLAGQHAQQLHMAFVECALLVAVHGHHADWPVVENQGTAQIEAMHR